MAKATVKSEVLDELLAGRDPQTVFEQNGLLDDLKKVLAERILNTELDRHLSQDDEQAAGNHRNGTRLDFNFELQRWSGCTEYLHG